MTKRLAAIFWIVAFALPSAGDSVLSSIWAAGAGAQLQQASSAANDVRFPVAHAHMGTWCMGYLYISADSIRYEVIRPEKDRKHSFQVSRSEITAVQQWVLLGTVQNATEIKTAHAAYHFWWMPNENDLQPGQPSRFNPSHAAAPDTLIAAIRDPSTVLGDNRTTSPAPGGQTPEAVGTQWLSKASVRSSPSDPGASQANLGSPFASPGNSDLNGTWTGRSDESSFSLILNADGTGSLNGLNLTWRVSEDKLSLVTTRGAFFYRASLSGDSLTLSGADLKQPLIFQRAKQNEPAGLFSPVAGANAELPIPGNPPLTQDMMDKGSQFFEWLLDVQLTVEQRAQFQDSLVRSWKTQRQDEIDATLNVVRYSDQLSQKSPEERRLVREVLREKYLNLMRQTANDDLSQWVLSAYYSAHRPIAEGNPPLTSQVADAYAEFVSFMVSECMQRKPFDPNRSFKDQLAQSLVAQYSSYSAEQQRQLSRIPLLWEALRFQWARLSGNEREEFRKQWLPAAQTLLAGQSESATGGTSTSSGDPASVQNYVNHYSEQLFVKNMSSISFASSMSLHLSMWK